MGCNFVPSTACNQLEMWQPATFDPITIERELGWASQLGFNSIRVFLHNLLWQVEGDVFLERIDSFLSIATEKKLGTIFVIFDGVWDPQPHAGPQHAPIPGVHNSVWVQSPGAAMISDRSRWSSLKDYLQAVIGRFAHDRRVDAWDLFNEPDNPNLISYRHTELPDKRNMVTPLVEACFDWATEVNPDQPLTAGVWLGVHGATERVSSLNRIILERSDVISFHSYRSRTALLNAFEHLSKYDRPLLCTEWLGRTLGSTVDLLSDFHRHSVGAYCWGLVDGRTQTRYPWTSWLRPVPPDRNDKIWFHDLLHADGRPYDGMETALIRRICHGDYG